MVCRIFFILILAFSCSEQPPQPAADERVSTRKAQTSDARQGNVLGGESRPVSVGAPNSYAPGYRPAPVTMPGAGAAAGSGTAGSLTTVVAVTPTGSSGSEFHDADSENDETHDDEGDISSDEDEPLSASSEEGEDGKSPAVARNSSSSTSQTENQMTPSTPTTPATSSTPTPESLRADFEKKCTERFPADALVVVKADGSFECLKKLLCLENEKQDGADCKLIICPSSQKIENKLCVDICHAGEVFDKGDCLSPRAAFERSCTAQFGSDAEVLAKAAGVLECNKKSAPICADDQNLEGGICKPIICAEHQKIENKTCIDKCLGTEKFNDASKKCDVVSCPSFQEAKNHMCINRCPIDQIFEETACKSCQAYEKIEGNSCVHKCPFDQALVDNVCKPIVCPVDQNPANHTCVDKCFAPQVFVDGKCDVCKDYEKIENKTCVHRCAETQEWKNSSCTEFICTEDQRIVLRLSRSNTISCVNKCTATQSYSFVDHACVTCPADMTFVASKNKCQRVCPQGKVCIPNFQTILPVVFSNQQSSDWGSKEFTRIGDFDGDGYPDIISANGDKLNVKLNVPVSATDPQRTLINQTYVTANQWGDHLFTWMDDFTGDKKLDVLSASGSNIYAKIQRQNPLQIAQQSWTIDNTWGTGWFNFVGDFNGDGLKDIASATGTNIYFKINNLGQGMDSASCTTLNQWGANGFSWAGDFNNDGITDIMSANQTHVYLKLSKKGQNIVVDGVCKFAISPNNSIVPIDIITTSALGAWDYTWVADFNGDGRKDIGTVTDQYINFKSMNADFVSMTSTSQDVTNVWATGNPWHDKPEFTRVGDINGDGRADFVTLPLNAQALTLRFSNTALNRLSIESQPIITPVLWGIGGYSWMADFDQDGLMDIITRKDSTVTILLSRFTVQ